MLFGSAPLSPGAWGPGQMVGFKGSPRLVSPQAALKLYTEVREQLTPKPGSQPLAALLAPSPAAERKTSPDKLICAVCLPVRLEQRGKKFP